MVRFEAGADRVISNAPSDTLRKNTPKSWRNATKLWQLLDTRPRCLALVEKGGNPLGVTWVAGAGLEYALSNKWSAKGEYLALGTETSDTASGPGLVRGSPAPQLFNWRHDIPFVQTAKFGLNYRL